MSSIIRVHPNTTDTKLGLGCSVKPHGWLDRSLYPQNLSPRDNPGRLTNQQQFFRLMHPNAVDDAILHDLDVLWLAMRLRKHLTEERGDAVGTGHAYSSFTFVPA